MVKALCVALLLCLPLPALAVGELILQKVSVSGVRVGRRRAMVRRTALAVGQSFDEALIAEARARLLETGLFDSVQPRLQKGSTRGAIQVVFECVERSTTSLDALHLGHARPTELWGGLELSDIDPIGAGFSLGLGAVTSEDQHAFRLTIGRPRFLGGLGLTVQTYALLGKEPFVGPRGQHLDAVFVRHISTPYRRMGVRGRMGIDLTPFVHLNLGLRLEKVSVELPRNATQVDSRGRVEPFDFGIHNGVLPVGALALEHDTRDDPAFPTQGLRASLVVRGGYFDAPFVAFLGGFETYWQLPFRHVLRFDFKGGAVVGDAPFFERFFIGDLHPYIPGRALGLNFARRRGPNLLDLGLDEQRYEDLAGRLGFEYRIPIGAGPRHEAYGIEFFIGGALLALGSPSETANPHGPSLPLDATIDLGLRIQSDIGVMGLSVGNLFLLLDPGE